jgi:hypothetical protein
MKSNIKKRWTAALRSGEYKQGTTLLSYCDEPGDIKYCCLGVLCEIEKIPSKWETFVGKIRRRYFFENERYDLESVHDLPIYYLKQIGLTCAQQHKLMVANDDGATFNEIADMIEEMA